MKGDGCKKKTSFRLSVKDYDFAKYFHDTCLSVLNFPSYFHYYSSDDRYKVDIYSVDFVEKYDSFIPKTIEQKVQYLKGFFDAEGSFCLSSDNHRRLSVTSGDVEELMRIKEYLSCIGISSTYYPGAKKRNCLKINSWDLTIRYMDLVGFRITRKLALWDIAIMLRNKKNMWNRYGVPQEIKDSVIRNYKTSIFSVYEMSKVYRLPRGSVRKILNEKGIRTKDIPLKTPKTPKYLYDRISYYWYKGLSIPEISKITGIKYGGIQLRLKRCGLAES